MKERLSILPIDGVDSACLGIMSQDFIETRQAGSYGRPSAEDAHLNRIGLITYKGWLARMREAASDFLRPKSDEEKFEQEDLEYQARHLPSEWAFLAGHLQDIYFPANRRSWAASAAVHVALVLLLFLSGLVFTSKSFKSEQKTAEMVPILIDPYIPQKPKYIAKAKHVGGGGGGDRSPLPASAGRLPRPDVKQFTPPAAVVHNDKPRLLMEPTIITPPDLKIDTRPQAWGDPLAKVFAPSNGPGSGAGIGSGSGGGVGSGTGPGAGPGRGGGVSTRRVYRSQDENVMRPVLLEALTPEYSDNAKSRRVQGTVRIKVIIDERGNVRVQNIVQSLDSELDLIALECIRKWRYKPAEKDGKAVAIEWYADVRFRLQ